MGEVIIHHVCPITPNEAFEAVMPGRAVTVSFHRPDQVQLAEKHCPFIMYENGEYSKWKAARRKGLEWDEGPRDYGPLYNWLDVRLWMPGRWCVIPDRPGAPGQVNDGLLNDFPFGKIKGAPLWHMNTPISRLGRLIDAGYVRICFGWIGTFDPVIGDIVPEERAVGCDAYRRVMDEVEREVGPNNFPEIHMMRGVAVARDYSFHHQRGRQFSRSERPSARLARSSGGHFHRALAGKVDRPPQLCGSTGRKAA